LADFMLANAGVVLDTSVASDSTITSDAPATQFLRHDVARGSP
jgi:hypothetical protein